MGHKSKHTILLIGGCNSIGEDQENDEIKVTGRRENIGFCEYYDSQAAVSATRNLNNLEIDDRRLKVFIANRIDPSLALVESRYEKEDGSTAFSQAQQHNSVVEINTPKVEPTSKTGMNRLQLIDALITLKVELTLLFEKSEMQAKELLNSNPRLSQDMFSTLLEHSLVEKEWLQVTILYQNHSHSFIGDWNDV
ncbi:17317_t:CDS:2 [Acaulospora colombiana]|uniref:17317_t:CDS:1 n=1 Tax=Acaulospora colombiana TaxID=27376 RepID=A0ACA9L599_9GLOM|nr:17317_t:CDS:2 [Acaulospora colombiana]